MKNPTQPHRLKRTAMLEEIGKLKTEAHDKGHDFPDFDFGALSDIILAEMLRFFRRLKNQWDEMRGKDKDLTPSQPPTAPPTSILRGQPTITNGRLLIDGKPTVAIGRYELCCAAHDYPNPASVKSTLQPYIDACGDAFGLVVRIWPWSMFNSRDLAPFERTPDGLWDLGRISQAYLDRIWWVLQAVHEAGAGAILVVQDFCYLRARPCLEKPEGNWARFQHWYDPRLHYDPGFAALDDPCRFSNFADYAPENGNCWTLSRNFWNRMHNPHDANGNLTNPLGCWNHPLHALLTQLTADRAKAFGSIIYTASEMETDPRQDNWDRRAMREFTMRQIAQVKAIYPTALIGTSCSAIQAEAQYSLQGIDIADVHGLTAAGEIDGGVIENIPACHAYLQRIKPGVVVGFNTDGWTNSRGERERAETVERIIRLSHEVGGFPEFKAGTPDQTPGIIEGIRRATT